MKPDRSFGSGNGKNEGIEKYIFVVGCPRSGTTLLQRLLLNVPGSFSMPETDFFRVLPVNSYVARRSLPPVLCFRYPALVSRVTLARVVDQMERTANLQIGSDQRRDLEAMSREGTLTVRELFDRLMLSYAEPGRHVLLEKTPAHVFQVDYIRFTLPEAIVLHIVRDPRDVYVSFQDMLKKQGKRRRSIAEFSFMWNAALVRAKDGRAHTLRYEDLAADPRAALEPVLSNHGLTMSGSGGGDSTNIVRREESWKAGVQGPVHTSSIGRYRDRLRDCQVAEIERRCGALMKAHGYTLDAPRDRSWAFRISDTAAWLRQRLKLLRSTIAAEAAALLHRRSGS